MITFSSDFKKLIGHDANGNEFSHAFTEGQPYANMAATRSLQQQADAENIRAAQNYTALLGAAQSLAASGHTDYTVPTKPLQKVVADTGEVTSIPFPGLPDFVAPPPPVTSSIPPAGSNSPWGTIAGASTVDVNARDARQFEMVSDIWAWVQAHK